MLLIVQSIKIELIRPKSDIFAIIRDAKRNILIQGKLILYLYHFDKIRSSSLRKHKKTVHGPDSHKPDPRKKPRLNPSNDDKHNRNKLATTVIKSNSSRNSRGKLNNFRRRIHIFFENVNVYYKIITLFQSLVDLPMVVSILELKLS